MKSRTLSATAMILLTPLVVLAFQAQGEQVRKGELNGKSFTAGPLKIAFTKFFSGGLKFIGVGGVSSGNRGDVNVEVENTSNDFTTFDPRLLSFIDKDDNQVNILGIREMRESVVAAESERIGPKAKIKRHYVLATKVKLPARLYYEDKLLATIID